MIELMPLRIPTGWAIRFNRFFDEEPIIDDQGIFVNAAGFAEDLLLIEPIPDKGLYPLPFSLDLGWYPAADPHGTYRLRLVTDNYEVVKEFISRDRQVIGQKIGQWLRYISSSRHRKTIPLDGLE